MWLSWLCSAVVLVCAAVSARFYRHAGKQYAEGKEQRIDSPRTFAYVYRYLQITTIFITIATQWTDHALLFKVFSNDTVRCAGLVLALVGFSIFISAKVALGRAYSPCFDSFVPNSVVRHGPYQWARHPIYTGNLLLLAGFFLMSSSLWLLGNTIVLFVYYLRAAVVEEVALLKNFPEYQQVLNKTGRFFPRVLGSKSARYP